MQGRRVGGKPAKPYRGPDQKRAPYQIGAIFAKITVISENFRLRQIVLILLARLLN